MTDKTTKVWNRYEKGKEYNRSQNLYEQTDKNWRFYAGDQWRGAKLGGAAAVRFNFIKPIVLYKVASIAQNMMEISYTPNLYAMQAEGEDIMNSEFVQNVRDICEKLNGYTKTLWELNKMNTVMWDSVLNACVSGDQILYFYKGDYEIECEQVDTTNVYFGDENDPDIESQPYIIIAFRRTVESVREEARANGIPESKIREIVSDNETEEQSGDAAKYEVNDSEEDGKCIVLLELYKKADKAGRKTVWSQKSTRNVIIQEPTNQGHTNYPIVHMTWENIKGSIRGDGEVKYLIDNQIEENKNLIRRAITIGQTAYPKMIYDKSIIANAEDITKMGVAIAIDGINVSDVMQKIGYLNPSTYNPDARNLTDEIRNVSQELAGASDAALGNIDPSKASGQAILAVRDAAQAPMSRQVAKFRQFVEDIGRVWFDMWTAYYPEGKLVVSEEVDELGNVVTETVEIIPYEMMQRMKVNVVVNVSPANPYNKQAQESTLENFLLQGQITFDEYVEALPTDATSPKYKLLQIIERRKQQQQMMMEQQEPLASEQMTEEFPLESVDIPMDEPGQNTPIDTLTESQDPMALEDGPGISEQLLLAKMREQFPGLTDDELLQIDPHMME